MSAATGDAGRVGSVIAAPQPAASRGQPFAGPASTAASSAASLALRDVLVTAFLRRKVMAAALLLPVAAGLLAAILIAPRWPAESLLLVQVSRESVGAADITGTGPTVVTADAPKVVQSEYDLLLSDAVLRRALAAAGPGAIFPGLGEARLFGLLPPPPPETWLPRGAQRLRNALLVGTSATSNVVRVTAYLPDRERSLLALRSVLDAYFAVRAEVFAQADAQVLSVETDRQAAELRALDAQIAKIRADARILDLPQDIQIANSRIDNITGRMDALRERKAAADAQLAAARKLLAAYRPRVVASAESTNLAPNDDNRNEMSRLLLQRKHMADQYAPDWPPLRELDQRIATLRRAMGANATLRSDTVREVRNPAVEQLSLRIATLEVDSQAAAHQMEELERQLTEAQGRAGDLLRAEAQLRDLGRRRDAMEASFRQVANRETGARVAEDARRSRSPTVTVAQPPIAAAEPRDLRLSFLLAGVLGGLLAAGGAAVLLTLFRRSFATADEAARGLALPPLAALPALPSPGVRKPAAGKGARPEADPAVADLAALLLDMRGRGERVVQFVAAGPEDGRGPLAVAVAAEIAGVRGLRTLLVDLETGGQAQLAALGADPSRGTRHPDDIMALDTRIPTLWIAYDPRGGLLGDPHAGIERTAALLDRLRRDLDAVVVVAPGDGAQHYAMRRLTALVDANVLVLRAERTSSGAARQARDAVLAAGGRLVGFVITGVRPVLPPALARLVA